MANNDKYIGPSGLVLEGPEKQGLPRRYILTGALAAIAAAGIGLGVSGSLESRLPAYDNSVKIAQVRAHRNSIPVYGDTTKLQAHPQFVEFQGTVYKIVDSSYKTGEGASKLLENAVKENPNDPELVRKTMNPNEREKALDIYSFLKANEETLSRIDDNEIYSLNFKKAKVPTLPEPLDKIKGISRDWAIALTHYRSVKESIDANSQTRLRKLNKELKLKDLA